MNHPKVIQVAYSADDPNPTYVLEDGRVFKWVADLTEHFATRYILTDITPIFPEKI